MSKFRTRHSKCTTLLYSFAMNHFQAASFSHFNNNKMKMDGDTTNVRCSLCGTHVQICEIEAISKGPIDQLTPIKLCSKTEQKKTGQKKSVWCEIISHCQNCVKLNVRQGNEVNFKWKNFQCYRKIVHNQIWFRYFHEFHDVSFSLLKLYVAWLH